MIQCGSLRMIRPSSEHIGKQPLKSQFNTYFLSLWLILNQFNIWLIYITSLWWVVIVNIHKTRGTRKGLVDSLPVELRVWAVPLCAGWTWCGVDRLKSNCVVCYLREGQHLVCVSVRSRNPTVNRNQCVNGEHALVHTRTQQACRLRHMRPPTTFSWLKFQLYCTFFHHCKRTVGLSPVLWLSNRFCLHLNEAADAHGEKRANRIHGLNHFTGEGGHKDFSS